MGQRNEIVRFLREAGPAGISKEILIFHHRFTQCGARVFELEQQGYRIRHESRPGEKYIFFVLVHEPENLKPLPKYEPRGPDPRQRTFENYPNWYERTHGPRPASKPQEPVADLPLFVSFGESE